MKKTFNLTHPKIKYPRLIEGVKSDVRKYLKRERNKKLPDGVDYWDFDCKYGATAEGALVIHVKELNAKIDEAANQHLESFYLEILAKPGIRAKKQSSKSKTETAEKIAKAPADNVKEPVQAKAPAVEEPVLEKKEAVAQKETTPPNPWDQATKRLSN